MCHVPLGELISFVPESRCPNFPSSIHGHSWKRVLRGNWNDEPVLKGLPKGFLSWLHLDDADHSAHETWEDLETNYMRVFKMLQSEGTLRDALLQKNGQVVHKWSCDPVPQTGK